MLAILRSAFDKYSDSRSSGKFSISHIIGLIINDSIIPYLRLFYKSDWTPPSGYAVFLESLETIRTEKCKVWP